MNKIVSQTCSPLIIIILAVVIGIVSGVLPAFSTPTETILHAFGDNAEFTDGAYPYSPLLQGPDGRFYGMTSGGGANGDGTLFKFDTALPLLSVSILAATATPICYGRTLRRARS